MKMKCTTIIILYCCTIFSILISSTAAVDTIRANETIRDGNIIVSAHGEFELGFFSPGKSTKRYLGIWYKKISHGTVVWVANRETPINDSLGVARVDNKGITVLSNDKIIWSSNVTSFVANPIAQLLDTGNLVFREENDDEHFVWQSFDYPANIMLPSMKLGFNLVTGHESSYTSWKSVDDPSPGRFSWRLDPNGFPQVIEYKDSSVWSRTGPWIGSHYSGRPTYSPNGISTHNFTINKEEIYYEIDLVNKSNSAITMFTMNPDSMNPDGDSVIQVWNDQNQKWMDFVTLHVNDCDRYGLCGSYGICNINNSPRCECMKGFAPRFPDKWKSVDWQNGCVRRKTLKCGSGTKEGFQKYSGVKLPDTRKSWYDMRINLDACRKLCLQNCNCTAYANADDRRGGSGCILWFNELIDIAGYTNDGQDIYVRMPASELGESWGTRVNSHLWLIVTFVVLSVIFALIFLHELRRRKLNREEMLKFSSESVALTKFESEDLELPLFDFITVAKATNNFYHNNKLGEGGFGPVYKGMLDDGKVIAVKRLSKSSCQGLDEFKNEVSCIAKLQHRNLVTLLGCCTEKGERILIYEYMHNKSLDSFIFDEESSKSVGWPQRYNIITGIARGLLYLHQDSKLRIIHRDLKASNILLDQEMNPKISDFGLARSFGGSQTEANTTRVVGTYGYMSPEYALDGIFSTKSDVYSFGVLLIEIVSGKKNRLFSHPSHSLNLIGHAWMIYKEDNLLELVDGSMLDSGNNIQVFRVIQIGLLCVQQYPDDRPSMSQVVLMLSSTIQLPHPKEPGFFTERKHTADYSRSNSSFNSSNQLTFSIVTPRE